MLTWKAYVLCLCYQDRTENGGCQYGVEDVAGIDRELEADANRPLLSHSFLS